MKPSCRIVPDGLVHLQVPLSNAFISDEPMPVALAWRAVCGQHMKAKNLSNSAYVGWPRGEVVDAPATCFQCIIMEGEYDKLLQNRANRLLEALKDA